MFICLSYRHVIKIFLLIFHFIFFFDFFATNIQRERERDFLSDFSLFFQHTQVFCFLLQFFLALIFFLLVRNFVKYFLICMLTRAPKMNNKDSCICKEFVVNYELSSISSCVFIFFLNKMKNIQSYSRMYEKSIVF